MTRIISWRAAQLSHGTLGNGDTLLRSALLRGASMLAARVARGQGETNRASVLRSLLVGTCLTLACSLAAIAGPASQRVEERPAAACHYDITATIDPDTSTISTVAQLTFRNSGPEALQELVFHFQPDQDTKPAALAAPAVRYLGDETADRPLKTSRFNRDGVTMEEHFVVHLPKPVESGETVRLEITSQCRIGDRWGMRNVEGSWHPRIVQRMKGAWQQGRDAFADYRVTVGPLSLERIPMSGPIVNRRKNASNQWTITSEATNIPDFAMVFSKIRGCVSGSQDGVAIHCFYDKPESQGAAERMLAAAKDIIPFYRGMYGYYPDRILNIVVFDGNGFGGGPFGSNIVQVNNTFHYSEDDTIWAVAHEIAHMYWGWNHVMDAQPGFSWLCLGMGIWTDRQYMDARKKDGQYSSLLYKYTNAAEKGLNTKLLGVTAADRKNRMEENPLAHGKGYQVILELEYLFGTDAVKTIARKTLERHAHQSIDARDFQAICQEVTSQDLEWFFHAWLYTSDRVDFVVENVQVRPGEAGPQIAVSVQPKGGIAMPVDVMIEYEDGTTDAQRLSRDQREATFASGKTWRRVVVDPKNLLPDTRRADNIRNNPEATPAFEILDVDLGDKAWGVNCMKVHVRNRTSRERTLFLHIGGRVGRPGFGMGEAHTVPASADAWVEHSYWVPPGHGSGTFKVSFTDPVSEERPQDDPPFLTREYPVTISLPNDRCNDLIVWHKTRYPRYRDVAPMAPLKYLVSEHFVFYSAPGTTAYEDRETLAKEHEAALAAVCELLGVHPKDKIAMFFYPDQVTKRICTGHRGDGFAEGNTIVEVYNKDVHLDPCHEITHVVAAQIGDPPAAFSEGLATWMQKDHVWKGEAADVTTANLLKDGRLVRLAQLFERDEIGSQPDDGQAAYPASASFVGFLLRTYGKARFLKAYASLKNDDGALQRNTTCMQTVFGQPLDKIEKAWHEWLLAQQ